VENTMIQSSTSKASAARRHEIVVATAEVYCTIIAHQAPALHKHVSALLSMPAAFMLYISDFCYKNALLYPTYHASHNIQHFL